MGHRVNIMLDDEVWRALQALPAGERSRFVNEVVSDGLVRRRQQQAWAEIRALHATFPPVPGRTEDWVREDRDSHP